MAEDLLGGSGDQAILDGIAGLMDESGNIPAKSGEPAEAQTETTDNVADNPATEPASDRNEGEARAKPETDEAETTKQAEPAEGEETETQQAEDDDGVEVPASIDAWAAELGVDAKELAEHVKVTVTVDGKPQELPLSEAIGGHQRLEDYRAKTAETAEQRRQLQAEADQFHQYVRTESEKLAALYALVEHQLAGDPINIDPQLEQDDPETWRHLREKQRERQEKLGAAQGRLQQLQQQAQARQAQAWQEQLQREGEALAVAMPEWGKDPDLGKREINDLRQFAAQQYGFKPEEVNQLIDHRMILAMRDLKKFHTMQGEAPKLAKKLKSLPKAIRSGAASDKRDQQQDKVRLTRNRFHKTNNDRDGAAFLLESGIVH